MGEVGGAIPTEEMSRQELGTRRRFWSGDASGSANPITVTVTSDKSVTANFRHLEADLGVAKSDSPDPVQVGRPLTYTLSVDNGGPDLATGVVVTDTLPPGVTFLSAMPD